MELQKVTEALPQPEHGRWYQDACGTAFAMELIGERWSLLVVRELMLGPRRFSDLRASLPGISAKVLTERLASLEAAGALVRRKLPPPASVQVYELTAWGYAAEPAIQELGRWAAMHRGHDPQLPLSPVSLMLSLRTMMDRGAAKALELIAGVAVGDDHFLAELKGGEMPVRRSDAAEVAEKADVALAADAPLPLLRLIYGKQPLEQAEQAGVRFSGDRALAEQFIALFSLPEKLA